MSQADMSPAILKLTVRRGREDCPRLAWWKGPPRGWFGLASSPPLWACSLKPSVAHVGISDQGT